MVASRHVGGIGTRASRPWLVSGASLGINGWPAKAIGAVALGRDRQRPGGDPRGDTSPPRGEGREYRPQSARGLLGACQRPGSPKESLRLARGAESCAAACSTGKPPKKMPRKRAPPIAGGQGRPDRHWPRAGAKPGCRAVLRTAVREAYCYPSTRQAMLQIRLLPLINRCKADYLIGFVDPMMAKPEHIRGRPACHGLGRGGTP